MVKSLTALNRLLLNREIITKPLTTGNCETYGKATKAYFRVADMDTRARVEEILTSNGFTVNRSYCRFAGNCKTETPNIEVSVTYRKAHGWNE